MLLEWLIAHNIRIAVALRALVGFRLGLLLRLVLFVWIGCARSVADAGLVTLVEIRSMRVYDEKKDEGVPTCHSQLNYILKKTTHHIFVAGRYTDVEAGKYIPYPDRWDAWEVGASGACNQAADLVCKQRVVCKMLEGDWSSTAREIGARYGSGESFDTAEAYVGRMTDACTLCVPVECPDSSCPFGRINVLPVPSIWNKVYKRPTCTGTCAAGTFLTCSTGLECRYQAPSEYHVSGAVGAKAWLYRNQYVIRSDLNFGGGWPLPVDSCYPCKHANGRTHFGNYFGTDATLYQDDFLQFECPGGALGPRACGKNKVAKFDSATGVAKGCFCRDGWYQANAGDAECTRCPPGYRCKWDGATPPAKKECDVDMYSFEGQSECRNCTVNTNICPKTQALTRCVRGGSGAYQSRDAFCTDCENCRQITNVDGALPCNRVISVVSASGAAIK